MSAMLLVCCEPSELGGDKSGCCSNTFGIDSRFSGIGPLVYAESWPSRNDIRSRRAWFGPLSPISLCSHTSEIFVYLLYSSIADGGWIHCSLALAQFAQTGKPWHFCFRVLHRSQDFLARFEGRGFSSMVVAGGSRCRNFFCVGKHGGRVCHYYEEKLLVKDSCFRWIQASAAAIRLT